MELQEEREQLVFVEGLTKSKSLELARLEAKLELSQWLASDPQN